MLKIVAMPDWSLVHRQLRAPSVTVAKLWLQYREQMEYPCSYEYFCRCYRRWHNGLNLLMRQKHTAGETMYVNYSRLARSFCLVDTDTGEVSRANLFVAVLGASCYGYAEACLTEKIDDWIACHIRAFHFFGGAARTVIPCQMGVEPNLAVHERYYEMARGFNTKVMSLSNVVVNTTVALQLFVRWIAAALRERVFSSLPELNAFIFDLTRELNARSFKKLPGSRHEWFESFERCALEPLPPLAYDREIWLRKEITHDHHVNVDGHYYSVPHQIAGHGADIRVTPAEVEVFFRGRQIALHTRTRNRTGRSSSKKKHEPPSGNVASRWTPDRVLKWANSIGPATAYLTDTILARAHHSQLGVRSCLGLLSLEKEYGRERLEIACRRAATYKSWTVTSIRRMLKDCSDQIFVQLTIPELILPPPRTNPKKRYD